MRLASLDLGTNALLLTVADWDGTSFIPIQEESKLIRLGRGLKKGEPLHPQARKRCLDALSSFSTTISRLGVEETVAVGTEALRRAADGDDFIQEIEKKWGFSFTIISPEEEAMTTFKATQREFSHLGVNLLMFDVGGGSTEIVYGDSSSMHAAESLDIGTVTVTERFIRNDPIPPGELKAAAEYVRKTLVAISPDLGEPAGVGIGGTVTTLKAVSLVMDTYDHAGIHGTKLSRPQVDDLVTQFSSITIKERIDLRGLPERRADIIPAGALITQAIMDTYGLSEIYVSDRGLRWGLLYDYIERRL